jgi:hypothetical protein
MVTFFNYFCPLAYCTYIREFSMKNHQENVPSFFLLLDTRKKKKKRPIDVADRLSIERGAADVQVRVDNNDGHQQQQQPSPKRKSDEKKKKKGKFHAWQTIWSLRVLLDAVHKSKRPHIVKSRRPGRLLLAITGP